MSIRVVLADDHRIVREGLRALLDREADMEVVAEVDDGRQAVQLARDLNPDVVVMDLSMPGLNGIEATRQVLQECAATKVLALSMHADRRFVADVLRAGASGYLLKDCALDELVRAIHCVVVDQTYLSPDIADIVVQRYRSLAGTGGDASTTSPLSAREQQVLRLIAEGKSVRNIADQLNLSVKTVETQRRSIMDKLNIRTIAGLTKYAIREGLTSLEQ